MSHSPASAPAAAFGVLLALLAAGAGAHAEPRVALESVEKERTQLRQRVDVLRDVAERGEMSPLESARRRFSDGETQFLLENYEGCEALLRDVVEVPEFQEDEAYPLALYYLGESLIRTGGHAEARRHFLQAAGRLPPGRRQQDVLLRLIALADGSGKGDGIDEHYETAVRAGAARPELIYRYAAWTAQRADVPLETRVAVAGREFERLDDGPLFPRALYYRGSLLIEAGRLDEAVPLYERVLEVLPPDSDQAVRKKKRRKKEVRASADERHLRDLSHLAIARILHAQRRFEEAIERYDRVPQDSPEYATALYEKADTLVRLNRFEDALALSELLRRVVGADGDGTEAVLLQARLLLQLGFHERAIEAFEEVIRIHTPDRDQIRAVLDRPNPVAFFEELLSRPEPFDLARLLPERARPFADTSRDIEEAKARAEDLRRSRADVEESRRLVAALLSRLDDGGLVLFPDLQETDAHAVQLANACAGLERKLVGIQVDLLASVLSPEEREELARVEQRSAELDERFRLLPKSLEELNARRERFNKRVVAEERAAAAVRRQLAELTAEVEALERAWSAELPVRRLDPALAAEMRATFAQYRRLVEQLAAEQRRLDEAVARERAAVPSLASGGNPEEALREQYREQIFAMQRIIARASSRLPASARPLLARTQRERTSLEKMQEEIAAVRRQLAERAGEGAAVYRRRVQMESEAVEREAARLSLLEDGSRQLLGEVAWSSFARVGRRFHDIVLQGEVGIVDVAWDRKEQGSRRITELSRARDDDVLLLQEQFREVLADVE